MGPEAEFEEFDRDGLWGSVYHVIRSEASMNHDFSLKDSRRAEFRSRNRYRDVSPYDHSRVRLGRDNIDYINANIVEAKEANRRYILSQGPLPHTSGHFWLMVWEQCSRAVLMLNRVIEKGRGPLPNTASHFWVMIWEQNSRAVLMLNRIIEKGQLKCHPYFPIGSENEGEDEMVFEDVDLKVSFQKESSANYFTVRTLELTDLRGGETKEVLHFHYTTWPDFGVPQSPAAFLNFLMAVRQSGALEDNVGPPVIHCSAGIGRSGTFCLVDTCLILIEKDRDPNSVDVRNILMDMRQYRMGLIQTPDQLRFSYLAIIEGAKRVLSSSPDSGFGDGCDDPTNNNVDQNSVAGGNPGTDDEDIPDTPPPLPPRVKRPAEAMAGSSVNSTSNKKGTSDAQNNAGENDRQSERVFRELQRQEGVDVRRRKREERVKKTADQIEKMKRKQREHEKWHSRRGKLQPWLIGLSISVLIGGYLMYCYYRS